MIETIMNSRQSVPVSFNGMTLYCEEFKASAERSFSEKATVTGNSAVSGSFPKAARLTFSGRIYSPDKPVNFVKKANEMLRSGTSCTLDYRGLRFRSCRVISYNAEDNGEEYITAVITFVTAEPIELFGGEE